MFCRNCGNEIEEEWKVCPRCGAEFKHGKAEGVKQKDNYGSDEMAVGSRDRKEVKGGLLGKAFSGESGGVILAYGANSISKDMVKILEPDEEAICFYHAEKLSITRWLKGARAFNTYILCTNQRFIYIEHANGVLQLIPFLTKATSVPYNEILDVSVGKRMGIFSGKIELSNAKKKMCFAVTDSKSAAELQEFLDAKRSER